MTVLPDNLKATKRLDNETKYVNVNAVAFLFLLTAQMTTLNRFNYHFYVDIVQVRINQQIIVQKRLVISLVPI